MNALSLLTMIRAIANDTITACDRQEYKTGLIHQLHNDKLQNLNNSIANNSSLNRSVKSKYFAEVRKVVLAPSKVKDYSLMKEELKRNFLLYPVLLIS